jgi:CDP-glycerol glycerophosphotransferase (TagB/SpsB family)
MLKLHPNSLKLYKFERNEFSNIYIFKENVDIYPILPLTDCLITDYSSIFFDYMLLEKEIVFYIPDFDKYRNSLRGFYFDYEQITIGEKFYQLNDLIKYLRKNNKNKIDYVKYKKIKNIFWDENICKSGSSKRICDFIFSKRS